MLRLMALILPLLLAASAWGQVVGRVKYSGPAPKLEPLNLKKHVDVCGEAKPNETLLLAQGGIKNVVISLEGVGRGKEPPKDGPAILDNKDCLFAPHVQAVMVGTPLEIRNSDPHLHNTRGLFAGIQGIKDAEELSKSPYGRIIERKGTAFNLALPTQGQKIKRVLNRPGMIALLCDEHSWMIAFLHVFDHPYFSVSDGDGKFKIPEPPPGKYQVRAWHEALGSQVREITVKAGQPIQLDFEFKLPSR